MINECCLLSITAFATSLGQRSVCYKTQNRGTTFGDLKDYLGGQATLKESIFGRLGWISIRTKKLSINQPQYISKGHCRMQPCLDTCAILRDTAASSGCKFCDANHYLLDSPNFLKISAELRRSVAKVPYSFIFLNMLYLAAICQTNSPCDEEHCLGRLHKLLQRARAVPTHNREKLVWFD